MTPAACGAGAQRRLALVGAVAIDCDVLTVPGSDLRIVPYTVAPGSQDASKLDLLRVAGLEQLVEAGPRRRLARLGS